MMRLPFVRPRGTDQAEASALNRIVERLDRLIAIGEQTNQLLEHLAIHDRALAQDAREAAQPKPAEIAAATPTSQPARADAAGRTEPTRGGRRRRRVSPGAGRGHVALERPRRLHEAIIQVLLDAGEALTANDIAARIRERNLFEPPRSGHELRGGQVSARVGNATYRDRFVRRDGRIWLTDPEGERLRLTIR